MKYRIFVDTSAWYALIDSQDPAHPRAKKWLENNRTPLLTTNHIFAESITLIKTRLGQKIAVEFGLKLKKSKFTTILFTTPEDEEQAWDIFIKYGDKRFSFVDCISFALMQRLEIDKAFTFDSHFLQIGYQALP